MDDSSGRLSELVDGIITDLSPDFVRRLIEMIREAGSLSELTEANAMREFSNDAASRRTARFASAIRSIEPSIQPAIVALGLECALRSAQRVGRAEHVDVVWTGPGTSAPPSRRTAAVLLGLIDAAQRDIILISFASFRVTDVIAALERAARRGVLLTFVLESAEDSGGRLKDYGENAYRNLEAFPGVKFLRWPLEKRPQGAVLHAKAVVVDGQQALVTSANLTGSAIESNLELGLLVRGGDAPTEIRSHMLSLIRTGELVEIA